MRSLLAATVMKRMVLLGAVMGVVAACGGATSSDIPGAASDLDAAGGGDGRTSGDASSGGELPDAGKTAHVPAVHRPTPAACAQQRGPGNANANIPFGACKTDAECTEGKNGRCNHSTFGAQTNNCSYDTCFDDSECKANVCTCREDASVTNRCTDVGNCKVDADCGPSGYCSPSVAFDKINVGVAGYYCHTAKDVCVDDADCRQENLGQAKCAFDPAAARWACSTMAFLPP